MKTPVFQISSPKEKELRVLMITSEWPTPQMPNIVPFVVRQVDSLRRDGIEVDVFHFRGSKSPFRYLTAWVRLRKKMHRSRYDLVHAQWGQSAVIAFPKKFPLVITFRGSDLRGLVGRNGKYNFTSAALRRLSRFVSRFADKVIVVAEQLARDLPAIDYQVIPSGLDVELFRPLSQQFARERLGLTGRKNLILFAADPAKPVKRFELASAAVSILREDLEAELVVTTGVPHEEMPYYMAACDVLLLTSLHEGSPNVVKEALACNLPIVSVDVGDVRARVGDLRGCVVCADDRPATIARGLAKVLSAHEPINGRQTIIDLDERTLTQRLIQLYREAVASSPRNATAGNPSSAHLNITAT